MAYNKNFYPTFDDIQRFTATGVNAKERQDSVDAFLTDPDHADYRIIHVCQNFVPRTDRILSECENRDFWTNITILYTE